MFDTDKQQANEGYQMEKHVSFSKIPQFRNVVRNVNRQAGFIGFNENDEPIYNKNVKKPIITFKGTVKIHGSNGAVCMSNEGDLWYQSRKNILSMDSDNNGFYQFCHNREEAFRGLFERIADRATTPISIVSIFGEYCGEGINAGCAIHKLPKRFVIFDVKVVPEEGNPFYVGAGDLRNGLNDIYNINAFETFEVDVDFNYPELAQNKFVELVGYVERECPVGKGFGVSGIGEGIVWTGSYKGERYIFKTKGEKHSDSKVKKVAQVDIEKVNSIREFVEYAVTENRMEQAVEELFAGQGVEPEIQQMGDFLRWIMKDIVKEESDVLNGNNLGLKDVGRHVANKARTWFQERLNENGFV